MSKPRHDWWSYVKGMIRRYPELSEQYEDIRRQSITASYSGMPGGGGESRSTERVALKEMTETNQREYNAITAAVEETKKLDTGKERLTVINLVFWKGTHTLEGAALCVPCHYRTAQEYHREFIYCVAKHYGLLR